MRHPKRMQLAKQPVSCKINWRFSRESLFRNSTPTPQNGGFLSASGISENSNSFGEADSRTDDCLDESLEESNPAMRAFFHLVDLIPTSSDGILSNLIASLVPTPSVPEKILISSAESKDGLTDPPSKEDWWWRSSLYCGMGR